MANKEHLAILKQGVDAWNNWRKQDPDVMPDLDGAPLFAERLGGANLSRTGLVEADLNGADLRGADLSGANLVGAALTGVSLYSARLQGAILSRAKLNDGDLSWADFTQAELWEADLRRAELYKTNFSRAFLKGADLSDSTMLATSIGYVDLSAVTGLKTVRHLGPSTIGIDTIYLSQGKIPEAFLRGAGIPENFITFMGSLVAEPIEYYSCFISYSSMDEEFAKKLHRDLREEQVRCWIALEDMRIGDEIRPRIDEAIRIHDKLLIVLSENSVGSPWVRKEVETAFGKEIKFETEQKQRRTVLFPIRLDDAVMKTEEAWAADIRRMRHIGDFREWKDHDEYQKALGRLMRDLRAEERMAT